MPFYRGRHVVSARDFDKETLEALLTKTAKIKKLFANPIGRAQISSLLRGRNGQFFARILLGGASTRTATSFADAIRMLGGSSETSPLEFSSRSKGETYRSTARIIGPRCDAIVIRDDREIGAAQKMADAVDDYEIPVSVINAGDGNREHPTQMLLDLFTIDEYKSARFRSGSLAYAMVGDLGDSRTIHSLLLGLALYGGTIFLVSTHANTIPSWLTDEIKDRVRIVKDIEDPKFIAPYVDVWYFTRLQKNLKGEKISEEEESFFTSQFGAVQGLRSLMKQDAIALHPLPHGPEFSEGIDRQDRRFIHYQQADNGFFVRMALLLTLFCPEANF